MRRMALKIFIFTDHLVSAHHQSSPSALARYLSAFRNLSNSAERVSPGAPGQRIPFYTAADIKFLAHRLLARARRTA